MNCQLRKSVFLAGVAYAGVALAHPGAAYAQDTTATPAPMSAAESGAPGPDEIVVTARLRSESLVDVPVAISALTQEDVQRYAATDLTGIAQLSPQITLTRGTTGTGATFAIRGVGSSSGDGGIDSSVAIALDGIVVSRGAIVTQGMFDIQQVEVLKGPQSLFFGKNSSAGVVSIKSADPTSTFQGGIKAGYEFEAKEYFAEGFVSGPISDTLKGRLALRFARMDEGWVKNLAVPRPSAVPMFDGVTPGFALPGAHNDSSPRSRDFAGRLTLVWEPSDDFDAKLKVLGGWSRSDGALTSAEVLCEPGQTLPLTNGVPDAGSDCALDSRTNNPDMPAELAVNFPRTNGGLTYEKNRNFIGSLTLNRHFGDITATSITGYYRFHRENFENVGNSSIGPTWGNSLEKTEMFTQELRLISDFDGPLNFVLGGYFETGDRSAESILTLPTGGSGGGVPVGGPSRYNRPDPVTGVYYDYDRLYNNTMRTYSALMQMRWQIIPTLSLDAGVRYTHERKRTVGQNVFVHTDKRPFYLNPNTRLAGTFQDGNFSPEVTLSWKPAETMTLFAAYKSGFKSGGFSNSTLGATATIGALQFNSEKADGFDLGFKGEFLDRRLALNITGYRYTFSDLQVSTFIPPSSFLIRNAATARTTGIEGELRWRATDQLSLRTAVAYNKGKYVSYPNAPCYSLQQLVDPRCVQVSAAPVRFAQDLSGRSLHRSPEWSLNGGFTYAQEVGSDLKVTLTGDASYTSKQYTLETLRPLSMQDGYWLLNASLRLSDIDDRWEVALLGKNLTNERYFNYSLEKAFSAAGTTPAQIFVLPQRTRSIQVQVGYKF